MVTNYGEEATKREWGRANEVLPLQKGGAEVLTKQKGGGGAKSCHPLKGGMHKVLPCLDWRGGGEFQARDFTFCSPPPSPQLMNGP